MRQVEFMGMRWLVIVWCIVAACNNVALAESGTRAASGTIRSDLPAIWNKQFLFDPEFGTQVLVVQSGMQHPQAVVLVHGLGQSGLNDWLEVIPQLEKRFHVIVLDLPGFGSSKASEGRFTPTRYARVLKHVVDHLGKPRPIIVGHSLGGAVALRYASLYPDQLSRMVLVDAAGILERTAFLKLNTAMPIDEESDKPYLIKRALESLDYLRSSMVEQSGFTPDPIHAAFHNDDAWQWLVGDSPNTNAGLALFTENFSEAVYTVNLPITIIWGSEDRVAPLRTGKILAHRLPQATLSVINGAAHVPMKTHLQTFMPLLLAGLEQPVAVSPVTPLSAAPPSGAPAIPDQPEKLTSLRCKRVRDATYTGRYKNIVLNGCRHITLVNLQAEKIVAEGSDIVLDNVTITSPDIAIESQQSLITATNVDLRAPVGIHASRSRLDLAGINIMADQQALVVERKSRVIVSTSRIVSPHYSGYAHGTFSLRDATLEQALTTPAR